MTESSGPSGVGGRSSPTSPVVHGQKVVDRSDELLPPGWVPSPRSSATATRLKVSGDSRVSLIDSAGTVRSKLVDLMDEAKEVVCACSFLIADDSVVDALLRAHERGIRVYLLTASETQLLKEPRIDNEFDAERVQDHIKTLRSMAGRILVRTGEHFHSKFVIADPNKTNAKGLLLTANLTSEALTRNVEIAVELTTAEVRDLFKQFLIGFWRESTGELLEPGGGLGRAELMEEFAREEPRIVASTANGIHSLRDAVERLVQQAKSEIIVSSFGYDSQHEIVRSLITAAISGKRVQIFVRPRPNKTSMNSLIALRKSGANVRGHPWLHAKCLIVDTEEGWSGLVMTANLEAKGLDEGFETGVLLGPREAESLRDRAAEWDEVFPWELSIEKRVGEVEGDTLLWINEELRKFSVKKTGEINLGEFRAKTIEEMQVFSPDISKVAARGDDICHKCTYKFTVLPPKTDVPTRNAKTMS